MQLQHIFYLTNNMKDFKKEFNLFLNKLKSNENFSLSRFGDGELAIIKNNFIDFSNKCNGEHIFIPEKHEKYHILMKDSLKYKSENYFVGISCKCCVEESDHILYKKISDQNESHLTFATIFVNSNYKLFLNQFIPELKNKQIILISHEKSEINKLPFKVEKHFKIGANAWINNFDMISEIAYYSKTVKNKVFLFAAGTFSNIAIYECHKNSKDNTYVDIGSTLDPILGLGATRRYLRGKNTINKTCIW